MDEQCWFCKKNKSDPLRGIGETVYRVSARKFVKNKYEPGGYTLFRYERKTIIVPRCKQCAEAHKAIKKRTKKGIAIGMFLLILSVVVMFILIAVKVKFPIFMIVFWILFLFSISCFIGIILWNNKYLKSKGTLSESQLFRYFSEPQVIKEGWLFGKSPRDGF